MKNWKVSYDAPGREEQAAEGGLDNFIRLFHDKDFLKALLHTFLMVAVVVFLITDDVPVHGEAVLLFCAE